MKIDSDQVYIEAQAISPWFECSRLKIRGLDEKTYSIAIKTIPTTFLGRFMHFLRGGDKIWTQITYFDLTTKKIEKVYISKSSIIKHLGNPSDCITDAELFIFTKIQPKTMKEKERLILNEEEAFKKRTAPKKRKRSEPIRYEITRDVTNFTKQELFSNLEELSRSTLLTLSERTNIVEYWMRYLEQNDMTLQSFGIYSKKSEFSILPAESGLKHTLQIGRNSAGQQSLFIIISLEKRPSVLHRSPNLRTSQ